MKGKVQGTVKKLKGNSDKIFIIVVALIFLLIAFQIGSSYYNKAMDNKVVEFKDDAFRQYLIEIHNFIGDHVEEHWFPKIARLWYLDFGQQVPQRYLESMEKGEIPKGYLSMFRILRIGVDKFYLWEEVDHESLSGIVTAFNQINSLEDLDKFDNLLNLVITDVNVTDFSPISKIKTLNSISLTKVDIQDLTPLAGSNLNNLYLRETSIESLDQIKQLQNLHILELRNNANLKDILITDHETITSLIIDNTAFIDFAGALYLENMKNLEVLISQGGSYEAIQLKNLPRLRTIEISSLGSIGIDETTLSNTGSNVLEEIKISGSTNIKNLNFLNEIETLKFLRLIDTNLGKVTIPSSSKTLKLEALCIENANLTEISGLENLSNLSSLCLSNNDLEDISFLFDENNNIKIQTLRHLSLENNRIPQWQIDKYEPILRTQLDELEIGEQR